VPTQKRMFLPPTDIRRRLEGRSRRFTAKVTSFGCLTLPGGGRSYPEHYVDALQAAVTGPITAEAVRRFNADDKARKAMQAAQTEFERRVAERAASQPQPGLLTLDDVAWLIGVTRSTIDKRRKSETLPVVIVNEQAFVEPAKLLELCEWELPPR
jgi:hypothetical protein